MASLYNKKKNFKVGRVIVPLVKLVFKDELMTCRVTMEDKLAT